MGDIRFDPEDARRTERTEASVVKVRASRLGQDEPVEWYLEPGESVEVADDGPNYIETTALSDDSETEG